MVHCLDAGGGLVDPSHLRVMLASSEICRATATILQMNYEHHSPVCEACATVCESCAASCDRFADMRECAQMCRQCAAACRETSKMVSVVPA